MTRIKVLALAAVLCCVAAGVRGAAQEGADGAAFDDIRQVDFHNFTYRVEREKGRAAVRLRGGGRVADDGAESGLQRLAYGDVTGDGAEEAVVLLRGTNTRVSRTLDEVFVYTLKDRKVMALAHFEGGRRGDYVLSVASLGSNFHIKDRLLVLDLAILREGEHAPTQYFTIKYRWNGVQMAEVERSCLKPLPEGMREVG